jgi:hypothetical protein
MAEPAKRPPVLRGRGPEAARTLNPPCTHESRAPWIRGHQARLGPGRRSASARPRSGPTGRQSSKRLPLPSFLTATSNYGLHAKLLRYHPGLDMRAQVKLSDAQDALRSGRVLGVVKLQCNARCAPCEVMWDADGALP